MHGGDFDVASTLWALARRLVPLPVLRAKVAEYVSCGFIHEHEEDAYVQTLEQMHGVVREYNVHAVDPEPGLAQHGHDSAAMTMPELVAELERREVLLRSSPPAPGVDTDQWRVYSEITRALQQRDRLVRFFIQASAGTGKSFLLETLFLWCLVHEYACSACAPTGIAAARIHIPRTPVRAYTLHYLFSLDVTLQSKLDPEKPQDERFTRLATTRVLITDEASMIDDATWLAVKDQLTTVGAAACAASDATPLPPMMASAECTTSSAATSSSFHRPPLARLS